MHASLANEIGLRIVRGDYPPGTILPNEAKWSETFEVSRSAVREAIKMLMAKSLLASRPKVGSWVEPRERWNLLDRDVLGLVRDGARPRNPSCARCRSSATSSSRKRPRFAAERRTEEQMAEISAACREMGEATTLAEPHAGRHALPSRHPARLGQRTSGAARRADRIGARTICSSSSRANSNDVRHAQKLHEAIEKNIRLQRPEAARAAVRKLLANTDEVIIRDRR